MKIKLKDILQINNILKAIIENSEIKIDPLFKFKLLGIMKGIEIPINNFETIRNEKIRECGKENEEGNIFIPSDDKESIKKFSEEMEKVIYSDVEVNIQKLSPSDVFDKGLPADYLVGLYPIIEE